MNMRYEKILVLPPPPPTESGRILEITENFCYYPPPPPPLNRDGFWRSRQIYATTPPPVSCCAPPRLPAPDPPLLTVTVSHYLRLLFVYLFNVLAMKVTHNREYSAHPCIRYIERISCHTVCNPTPVTGV